MVLLKGHGPEGFTFFTNAQSRKGEEIRANMQAALLFHWKSLRRQIRIEGPLKEVSAEEADAYFHSRARVSQIGSAASDQSRPLDQRATYFARVEALGRDIPRAIFPGRRIGPASGSARSGSNSGSTGPTACMTAALFTRSGAGWTDTLLYP